MLKVPVSSLKRGMKLAKPILNEGGMILFGAGTELTDTHIQRLEGMNISTVFIEGSSTPEKSKEEMLSELDARFKKTEGEPLMAMLKTRFIEHIEELYK